MIEKFAIDYLKIFKDIHIIQCEYNYINKIFSAIEDFNIESLICSEELDLITIITHKDKSLSYKKSTDKLSNILTTQDFNFIIIDNLILIEISGSFIGGSIGLTQATLDTLKSSKINIEYQLMNPKKYSVLIESKKQKRAIKSLSEALNIRDNMISII